MTATTGATTEASKIRHDIHREYERLRTAGTLTGSVRGNDIHAIVEKYIPEGSNLEQAGALLRQAGFEVGPGHPTSSGATGLYASSKSIAPSTAFGTSNEVVIELGSAGSGGDATVTSIAAHLYATSL